MNKWAAKKLELLIKRTGVNNICISGGVAQNGVMNAFVEQQLACQVFVPPFPSDQGQSLGNAIYAWISVNGLSNNSILPKSMFCDFKYLGSEFSNTEIQAAISMTNISSTYTVKKTENIAKETAQLLFDGKIVGWFQGKSEYGCRALGARSILSSPCSAEIRDRVNTLKRRELFRPLAPTVLAEYTNEYFNNSDSFLSEYMLGVVDVIKEQQSCIEGVTHVDGTARIQSLTYEQNPLYYALIKEFFDLSGIPLIMNTSFNMAGEPIVETPIDAINAFRNMNLDALVCGNYLIEKKN